jgi:serine/threonine-protein kinase
MGVVYLATDLRLGRAVAVKLLSPELTGDDRFRNRFIRESRLAAGLEHPHIVPIHAAGEGDDALYLAMRFIDGHDLRGLIDELGRIEPSRAALIVRQVAGALDVAHAAGLVHRDVKPANVLIGQAGGEDHAYLSDFGLTKQTSSLTGLTMTGQLVGTLDYVAPEVIVGEPAGAHADQYALACMAYEMLTGEPPFRRGTEAAALWAHINDPAPGLPDDAEGHDGLERVIQKGLAKDPADRYETCGAFAQAFSGAIPGALPQRRGLTRSLVAASTAVVLVAVVITAILTSIVAGGSGSASHVAAANTLVALDPRTGDVVGAPISVGREPTQVAVSGNVVWVANAGSHSITAVDTKTRKVIDTVHLGVTPTGLAPATGNGVWVAAGLARELLKITPTSGGGFNNTVTRVPGCCAGPSVVTTSGGKVFVGDSQGIHVVDAATGRVGSALHSTSGGVFPATGDASSGVNDHVVFTDAWGHTLAINTLLTAPTVSVQAEPGEPTGVTRGGGYEWIVYRRLGEVRGSLGGERQASSPTYHVAGSPIDAAFTSGKLFVASSTGTITSIDPTREHSDKPITVGERLGGIAAGAGFVWVTVQPARAADNAVGRILFMPDAGLSIKGFADVRASGGPPRHVATGVGTMPSPSPDGKRFAYSARAGGTAYSGGVGVGPGLEIQTFGAQQAQRVAGKDAFAPRFSPDGRWLAYWQEQRHGSAVIVAHADGSNPQTIWTSRRRLGDLPGLDWSPDATRIVIQQPGQGGGVLSIINADGSHEKPLTLYPAFSPRWSPDGTRIAYLADVNGAGVYVTGLDGQSYLISAATEALSSIGGSGSLTWSPDGRQIAYAAWTGPGGGRDGEDITVVNADGTGGTPITHTGGTGATLPAWMPYT